MNPINMPTEENQARIAAALEQMAKGSIFLPRLSVSAPAGVDITVTDGHTILQKTTESTTTIFDVPNYGTWTVSYTSAGEFKIATVEVNMVKIYPVLPTWAPTGTFAETSWADIVKAAQMGVVPAAWQKDDAKDIPLSNEDTIQAYIIGKDREKRADNGKTVPLVLCFKDCNGTHRWNASNTNVGGFGATEYHDYCEGDLYNMLPAELKAGIVPLMKKTSAGNQSTEIVEVECKLWPLSVSEVFSDYSSSYSPGGEGDLFPVFTDNASRIKLNNGSATNWSLRSPYVDITTYFCYVTSDGTLSTNAASLAYGVVVGFGIG